MNNEKMKWITMKEPTIFDLKSQEETRFKHIQENKKAFDLKKQNEQSNEKLRRKD